MIKTGVVRIPETPSTISGQRANRIVDEEAIAAGERKQLHTEKALIKSANFPVPEAKPAE